jgi:acyl transferase domain-containing protein/acyl carrier protein
MRANSFNAQPARVSIPQSSVIVIQEKAMIDNSVSPDATRREPIGERETDPAAQRELIAIIGIGCRFPGGANDPEAFWKLLCDGVDAISDIPLERFDVEPFYDPTPGTPGKMVTRWGGFLKDIDKFDASFFGISPREASSMDPQQRLLLEVAWEALEDAGQVPVKLVGSRTGVFLGMCYDDYINLEMDDTENIDIYVNTGGARSVTAGRISYALGLQGPCLAIDTACSSSLVAVHLACQSIHNGESAMALAGGVNLILQPEFSIGFSQASMLSPDGRCKAFDARANGFVRSDGVGLVLLKRLSQAQADGDPIYAVIRGGAVNNDGRSGGFLMTPSQRGQEAVMRDAYRNANVSPGQVHYIEAHGTGTSVGDPIEAGALGAVITEGRAKDRPCMIGSVKTNIGHTEAASGIAGLIKVALSLKHRAIPANLHLQEPNPKIPFDSYSLAVQREYGAWPVNSTAALAGISSFGINGTNAHLVLEEAPAFEAMTDQTNASEAQLLTLSAQSHEALKAMAQSYRAYLMDEKTNDSLRDICYTASARRAHHEHSMALVAHSREELAEHLEAYLEGTARGGTSVGRRLPGDKRKLVFVFPGQGAQWFGMGRELLQHEPVFRESLKRCEEAMSEFVEWSLLEQINLDEQASRLNEIEVIQPTLFAIQVSLVALWRAWGIEPDAVIGQSMGEVAAAHVAGALSLRDAARIICRRSRLLKSVSGQGGMAVVGLSFDQAQSALGGYESSLSIAVSSSPLSTVISGDHQALEQLIGKLEAQDIFARLVKVDIASHSPQMEPLREDLLQALEETKPQRASVPVYSTVEGRVSDGQEFDAGYWVRNLRKPVLFSSTVERLLEDGHDIFIEISPNPVVLSAIQQTLQHLNREALLLSSMQRDERERAVMLGSLGSLYTAGRELDWNRLYPLRGRSVQLPSYPWQRERFWIDDHESNGQDKRRRRLASAGSGHPLLGEHLRSAVHSGTYFWESELSVELLPYLADHRVQGMIVLPAAAYVETALAAASVVFDDGVHELEELTFKQPLFLTEEGTRKVQVVVSPRMAGTAFFQFFSLEGDIVGQPSAWTLHMTGIIRRTPTSASTPMEDFSPEQIQARCLEVVKGAEHYEAMQERGLYYGDSFQGVEQIWRRDGESLGRLSLAPALQASTAGYSVHPALLDACFQVVAGTLPAHDERVEAGDTYVPVGIGSLNLFSKPDAKLWSHATLEPCHTASADSFEGNVFLHSEDGELVLAAHGLRLQRMDRAGSRKAQRQLDEWLYEIEWERAKHTPVGPTPAQPSMDGSGNWLIFADQSGVGLALKSRLETCGERVVLVFHEDGPQAPDRFQLNPTSPEDFRRLLKETAASGLSSYRGVVHLWSLDAAPSDEITSSSIDADRALTCASLLHLVQALSGAAGKGASPRLWLVSSGIQRLENETGDSVSLSQSPVWGLGRVITNEHPELRCTNVDLATSANTDEIEALFRELYLDTEENEIVLRGSERYVARMVRCSPEALHEVPRQRPLKDESEPFRLEVSTPGILDNLILREIKRRAPGPGEVEIEVRATGLNFRDVMLALGLLPPVREDGPIDLGWECAGTIAAIGEGVHGFEIGDEVLAVAPPCFSSYAMANSHLVMHKPAHLSFEEAATIPVAYITAHYSFQHMGRLREGERVLIHAASGAVGIAAVQLAQWMGAEVFATAGSPEKREFLKSLGVKYVMDSRSLDFAEEILSYTGGEGVDVVLNSIAGEAIPKSLSILRLGGRFLELGKTDILQNGQLPLKPFQHNLAFFAIDLSQMFLRRPAYCGVLFREVMQYFIKDHFQPPPLVVYPLSKVVNAFHFMARASHIGKLVISIADKHAVLITPASDSSSVFQRDASYLITGGLGGLGLTVARWMVEQGARHLVLMGRSGASLQAEKVLDELREAGATVMVARADVTEEQEVSGVLARIREAMPPLRGILHAAAVLDDGILLQLDEGRFKRVMSPKINGAWNLHQLTLNVGLDFFVLFSSAASMLGSPGQGNYVAANAFLDALARYRRARNLPALCINWGPWAEVGLAARPDRGGRLELRGVGSITPTEGLEALGQLLRQSSVAEVGVMPFNLQQWCEFYPAASRAPIFARLAREQSKSSVKGANGSANSSLAAILVAAPEERRQLVETYLQEQLAKVLRLAAFKLDVQQPINKLGLDSLMAVELKNRIQNDLGVTLLVVTFLKGPSLAQLATQVLDQLAEQTEVAVLPSTLDVSASLSDEKENHAALDASADGSPQATTGLDDFSDDEVDSLLSNMLAEEDEFNERDLPSYR